VANRPYYKYWVAFDGHSQKPSRWERRNLSCWQWVSLQRNDTKYGVSTFFSHQRRKTATPSTPLAVIEVGRNGSQWWKKLDQNLKYLANMGSHQCDKRLEFRAPPLWWCSPLKAKTVVLMWSSEVRLEVFLLPQSSPHRRLSNVSLWHSRTNDLTKASRFRKTSTGYVRFPRWREKEISRDTWTYLGPKLLQRLILIRYVAPPSYFAYRYSLPNEAALWKRTKTPTTFLCLFFFFFFRCASFSSDLGCFMIHAYYRDKLSVSLCAFSCATSEDNGDKAKIEDKIRIK
jgi:hypothetical protein